MNQNCKFIKRQKVDYNKNVRYNNNKIVKGREMYGDDKTKLVSGSDTPIH